MKKLKKVIIVLSTLVVAQINMAMANPLYLDIESSTSKIMNFAFHGIAAIPLVLSIFCIIQGITTYGESKMEGASAQASGKAYGFFSAAVVLIIAAVLVETAFKDIALDAMNISG